MFSSIKSSMLAFAGINVTKIAWEKLREPLWRDVCLCKERKSIKVLEPGEQNKMFFIKNKAECNCIQLHFSPYKYLDLTNTQPATATVDCKILHFST